MCLILFAYQVHPDYPLILAANRDEFYQRPAQAAHWWPEHPQLLAGKDLDAGGTWLGISKNGRFAAVTNVREPKKTTLTKQSRGLLPINFLCNQRSEAQYSRTLMRTAESYQGYNLLYGSYDNLHYYSNRNPSAEKLNPGIFGLSNAALNTPWPKVRTGIHRLQRLIQRSTINLEALLDLLSSTDLAADDQLPATGVSLEWERQLSAIRIVGAEYGTRVSTALLIDKHRQVSFLELPLAPTQALPTEFYFNLQ